MKKGKILVIDDEEHLAKMLKLNFEATGKYTVIVETKGSKAIETAKAVKPDFIFLDIVMKDLNGFEVMYQLEADKGLKDIPVVFLTGALSSEGPTANPMDDDMIGKYFYVAKPASLRDLVSCVEKHMKKG